MYTAAYFIEKLELQPHVEGGYYKEIYRSPLKTGDRSLATTIYFLLEGEQLSRFHQLTADEIWFFHYGDAILIHQISTTGELFSQKLGMNLADNEAPQLLIPAGTIFASEMINKNSFALMSCLVSPGFEFADFTLFGKEELKNIWPQHEAIIERLAI
ncbi:MAG: cupin domain-containing protein [Ferruginibacter sp.]